MKYLNFKQLVILLSEITPYDVNDFCGQVEQSYQHEKITAKEYILLYKLLDKITKH